MRFDQHFGRWKYRYGPGGCTGGGGGGGQPLGPPECLTFQRHYSLLHFITPAFAHSRNPEISNSIYSLTSWPSFRGSQNGVVMQFLELSGIDDQNLLRDPDFLIAVIRSLSRNKVGDWRRGAFLVKCAPSNPTERIKPCTVRRVDALGTVKNVKG